MTSRRDQEVSSRQRLHEELMAEKEEEKQYDQFLQQETERMKLQEFTPRVSYSCEPSSLLVD